MLDKKNILYEKYKKLSVSELMTFLKKAKSSQEQNFYKELISLKINNRYI